MLRLPTSRLLEALERWNARKFLFLLFAFCFLLFAFAAAPAALAADVDQPSVLQSNRLEDFKQAVGSDELSRDRLVFEDFANLEVLMIYGLAGCEAQDCPPELKVGMINTVGGMIAGMYDTRPVSAYAYASHVIDKFRPTPAYAQGPGSGFTNLLPLLPIWRAFRDFTYILFAVAFVAMGFAVMFRVKLNPQVTITIQSALPRLIIGLLLITFSYAIAGFVIDLIYVFIAIGLLIFSQVPGAPELTGPGGLQEQFLTGGFRNAVGSIFSTTGALAGIGLGFGALGSVIYEGITVIGGAGAGLGLTGLAGAGLLGFAIGLGIFIIIILLIIAYLVVRLFIELLRSYIAIILAVIFAPFQIILGVVPGLPGFTGWLKGLLANALVFPAVALALVLGRVILEQENVTQLWAAPLLGGWGSYVPLLVGFGILLIVYQIPPAIRKSMGAEGLGFAPLEAVRFGAGPFVNLGLGGVRAATGRQFGAFVAARALEVRKGKTPLGLPPQLWTGLATQLYRTGHISEQEAKDIGIRIPQQVELVGTPQSRAG